MLLVGYGSIGKRHARLLKPLVGQLAVVSSQRIDELVVYATVKAAIAAESFDRILVCNETAGHADVLRELQHAGYRGHVLVEKPLTRHADEIAASYSFNVQVAYQLRFHPVILAFKDAIRQRQVLSTHAYVGQHLMQWRPDRDTHASYSAHKARGGGVVRDLSHELDLMHYLFGRIVESYAIAKRTSDVTVDSEDAAALAISCERCPVISLQMNYLDTHPKRQWWVNTRQGSIHLDLIASTITIDGQMNTYPCTADRAYHAMHQAWLDHSDALCSLDEARALCQLIDRVSP